MQQVAISSPFSKLFLVLRRESGGESEAENSAYLTALDMSMASSVDMDSTRSLLVFSLC